ncbi:MAG TPA: aminotransferase class III-fold pyridoxal phosphate-dependent enzyme, partial [Tepidisphaeraceae bacterium]|nr:aminotransferase class III-fold pyridoxal phosphate-dependent enzyme [Tepidisphaeraceae bacterium]
KLWHVGNSFHSEPQVEFAERLKKHSFDGRAFFCHSGLEANEAAVKLARLRGLADGGKKWKTVSLIKSFHGRSLAMISATGNPAVKEGFGPPVPGFINVEPMDFDALEKAIDDETCCIIMEPIQGEGGVNLFPIEHVARIRKLCDDRKLTLIFDEVWTGGGRTGEWFGYQWFKQGGSIIEPDIMTMGKAIGGGLPVAGMWAKPDVEKLLVPGKHGCTLGGNQICMKVAKTIFDVIERDDLLNHAKKLGDIAMNRLKREPRLASKAKEVRGHGLFIGIEFEEEPKDLIPKALEKGVVVNVTYKKIVRLAPPINISEKDLQIGLDRFIDAIDA